MILALSILCILFVLYKHIYNNGYDKAKNEDKIEYSRQLTVALNKVKLEQMKANTKADAVAQAEVRINTVYKDRIVTIDKIVEKQVYKDCKLSDDDFKSVNDALDAIK